MVKVELSQIDTVLQSREVRNVPIGGAQRGQSLQVRPIDGTRRLADGFSYGCLKVGVGEGHGPFFEVSDDRTVAVHRDGR